MSVSDSTRDAAQMTDEGFHEIQLSGKQLVFLFMCGALVAVAIFLCGVQVGRGVKSDRAIDAAAGEPAAPSSAASTPSPGAASSGPPAAEPPAPAAEPEDELSYAKRLQGDSAPAEKLKSPATAQPPSVAAAQTTAPPPSVAASRPPAAAAQQPSAPQAAPKPEAPVSTGQPGSWIVQLTALQDRSVAEGIAKRLAAKGYPAFVLNPAPGAPPYYRVQVGGYNDRRDADQIARRLEKDEQLKPYVRRR